MIYLLDTNTLSYIARGRSQAARMRIESLESNDAVAISAITEAEVRYGLARRPEAHALRAVMEKVLFKLRVLSWGSPEAEAYGELRARTEVQGLVLSALDLLIAAQARAVGATLITSDKAFFHLSGLIEIENWATDIR
ncbi:MAG: PIN domain-containing protein [Terracidiphilus sp.]|nr:PIN domain-containing protein [Terracidiphilus sp.]